MRLSLLLLALLALPACDSNSYNDGYDDGYGDGQDNAPTNGATFVDFSLSATTYSVSADNKTATFETDNIDSGTTRAAVERALAMAGDGALVALYIRNNLVNIDFQGESVPYSALPITRGFDEQLVTTTNPDGTAGPLVYVVGLTASYEYSFDNTDLYFDVVSSKPSTDFGDNQRNLFGILTPQRQDAAGVPQGPSRLEFRLVTVPASAARGGSSVDMGDYAAVARTYNLPD